MTSIAGFDLSEMDIIIYGGFLGLSLAAAAFNHFARNTDQQKKSVSNANFISFQRRFFVVYFLALSGDWLQGPYVYKLYEFYGFKESQIAVLYVAGFASSVFFGTFTGPLADIVGRKKVALSFCISYIICCLTKLSASFWILMAGRILGGISTSMLFSTFESWYVYEHSEHHGFPAEWIGVTFSTTTFWNGLLAIIAGVVANFTAEGLGYGPVAPFVVAILPLFICGLLIMQQWEENYGNRSHKVMQSCMDGMKIIFQDKKIFLVGGVQTMVESVMYIFVFLWTPVLGPAHPPLGMVFACFMVAIMIGSSMYTLLLSKGYTAERVLRLTLLTISVSMAICTIASPPNASMGQIVITYASFIVLELGIGMYFPAMSFIKSQVIPETHRANVMNWFRVPMNLITCGTLLLLRIEWISQDKRVVFGACLGFGILGVVLTTKLISLMRRQSNSLEDNESKQSLMDNIG